MWFITCSDLNLNLAQTVMLATVIKGIEDALGLALVTKAKSMRTRQPKVFPPPVRICDPELAFGVSDFINADTGLVAFARFLEAHCSPPFHPVSQGMALVVMRLARIISLITTRRTWLACLRFCNSVNSQTSARPVDGSACSQPNQSFDATLFATRSRARPCHRIAQ